MYIHLSQNPKSSNLRCPKSSPPNIKRAHPLLPVPRCLCRYLPSVHMLGLQDLQTLSKFSIQEAFEIEMK
jgi:hypothetical protein